MSLKRSIRNKSRSLNLRQRDDNSLEEIYNNEDKDITEDTVTELVTKEIEFESRLLHFKYFKVKITYNFI